MFIEALLFSILICLSGFIILAKIFVIKQANKKTLLRPRNLPNSQTSVKVTIQFVLLEIIFYILNGIYIYIIYNGHYAC